MTINKITKEYTPLETTTKINEIIETVNDKINGDIQYAPFSVNNGEVDSEGNNATLQYSNGILTCNPCTITTADGKTKSFETSNILDVSGVSDGTYKVMKSYQEGSLSLVSDFIISKTMPLPISETPFVQPNLNSNGTLGGDSFACASSSNYSTNYAWGAFNENSSPRWQMNGNSGWIMFYNPIPLKVTKLEISTGGSDYPINKITVSGSNDNSTFDELGTITNSTHPNTVVMNLSNSNFYRYYKLNMTSSNYGFVYYIKITAVYQEGSNFSNDVLWLDNSEYPLVLKQFDGINWQINNDIVYLGDVTADNGSITSITNAEFNKYFGLLSPSAIIEKSDPSLMPSWYRVYSDGWIEQGGIIYSASAATITTNFLKPFSDTNYTILITPQYTTNGGLSGASMSAFGITATSFQNRIETSYGATTARWMACGYGA